MKKANNSQAALLGLQHLLAMYSGAVAVPLLIGTALGFNTEQMTYLVSIDIFMCGLATLLQLMRSIFWDRSTRCFRLCDPSRRTVKNDREPIYDPDDVWGDHRSWDLCLFGLRPIF